MPDLNTLRTRLDEAEAARHKLLTGSLRERISSPGGADITYTRTEITALDRYISSLKADIARATGAASPRRAIRPFF
ncbi:hypothetical protein LHK_01659 [Laribacter hongkongensis HLHK9]|uniref:GpW n=1 Tax=Laribacter hongkongensis (strain HLHK9) TaxID=557598 RepID=C1D855_LARHH|nr:gpW family head-tail joining protein [Laribacter hongkongensis]ACO74645.1 hypothetical protein LHK_01659 [Laribacter hongkongensis HLHK9]